MEGGELAEVTVSELASQQAKQREEHDTKMERGYAALQRVQQRGMQDGHFLLHASRAESQAPKASPVRSSMA